METIETTENTKEINLTEQDKFYMDMMLSMLPSLYAKPESEKVQRQIDALVDVLEPIVKALRFEPYVVKMIMYNLRQKDLNLLYKAVGAAKRHS